MKTFKTLDNRLFAFEDDGSQDYLITGDMVPVTEEEADAIRNPPLTVDQLAAAVRAERNAKIAASDWTVLSDAPLTTTQKTAWKTYRQALRDITEQATFPQSVAWPELPQ